MSATIIDGKAFAAEVRGKVAEHVAELAKKGIKPGLAVVLVGEDPASQVYVRSKGKQTVEAGMESFEHKLDASTSEADLLALVADDDDGAGRCQALDRCHQVLDNRAPGNIVEDLVQPALEAGALTCGKDYGGKFAVSGHSAVPCHQSLAV